MKYLRAEIVRVDDKTFVVRKVDGDDAVLERIEVSTAVGYKAGDTIQIPMEDLDVFNQKCTEAVLKLPTVQEFLAKEACNSTQKMID